MSGAKRKDLNVTEGSLLKKIIIFAIPLMLTGLLQQFYNAADLVVVGMFAENGAEALAAVGSTGALTNLVVGLFMGLSVGAGVSIAHHVGAEEYGEVKRVVHTAIPVALVLGMVVSAIGFVFTPVFLTWMDNPLMELSTRYLRIIFLGVPASMVYNYSASMLRSTGDAKHPLIFLSISGLANVLLNLLLVAVFEMGVVGVAIATIASQYLSAAMVVIYLMRRNDYMHFSPRDIRIDGAKTRKMLYIGVPSGIQTCMFSLGNVMIQSSINSLGDVVMAGSAAAGNLEGFIYIAMNALYHVSLTFCGQAIGAKAYKSIKKIVLYCCVVVVVIGIVSGAVLIIFNEFLVGLYASDPAVKQEAFDRLTVIALTYFLCGIMEVLCGALRAMGKSITAMIVSLAGACGLRLLWVNTIFLVFRTPACVYLSYPVSWILTASCHVIFLTVFLKRLLRSSNGESTVIKKLHQRL